MSYASENFTKVRYLAPLHDLSIRKVNRFRYNAVPMPKMPTYPLVGTQIHVFSSILSGKII